MASAQSIRPKNWDDFQHYKDRRPTWIKLHRTLLDDFDFHSLPLASRALAPMLWLLAGDYEQAKIPLDYAMLGFRFRMSAKEAEQAIKPLIDKGFFNLYGDASDLLAECLPREEREKRERREETEGEKKPAKPASRKHTIPDDFIVSQRVEDWADKEHYLPNRVAANFSKFVLWARREGKKYVDWDAALMTAIRDDWAKVGNGEATRHGGFDSVDYRKGVSDDGSF